MDNYIPILINKQNHHFYGEILKYFSADKQIIPLLKKIPYDLHKTIYSYF